MGAVRITTGSVQRSVAALEAMKARIDVATMMATRESGREMQSTARGEFQGTHPPRFPHIGGDGSPPNVATGHLQGSISTFPTVPSGRGRWSTSTGPTAFYAAIIEYGKTITRKTAPYLKWFSPVYGWTQRKSVTLAGWPYMRPSHRKMLVRMHEIFYKYWFGATRG